MSISLKWIRQYEKYSLGITVKGLKEEGGSELNVFLDFPVVLTDIGGAGKKLRKQKICMGTATV